MTQSADESREDGAGRAAVFDALRARLLALAARVLGSRAEAEDVVQDAWLRWREADTSSVNVPQAWLATVTVRLAIDRLRRQRREREGDALARLTQPWLDDVAPSAEEAGLRAARLADAWLVVLARLGPVEQAVFVLREAFECDYAEIAALVGCTPAHCRQIVHRAKARLAREQAAQKGAQKGERVREAPADPARHARAVERLREVLEAQDRAGLMDLLGLAVPEAGTQRADELATLDEPMAAVERGALHAEALTLDGESGVVLVAEDGELAMWLQVRFAADGEGDGDGATAIRIEMRSDTPALRAANHVFGGTAVRRLLTSVASCAALLAAH
ncbi:sigma-70 family RNA polymerase sigma factor [Paraburkholderia sp. J12]|uniref:sigma-70 family RNA polymerase sigma factor n=1 Tax=Paraburkholderia sp. J12 TaxID=2805432 RepID=UPI002ABE9F6D|nr:sigma-70 family RNA polymerase sigma factor [Paraburkholderia sp. J12]